MCIRDSGHAVQVLGGGGERGQGFVAGLLGLGASGAGLLQLLFQLLGRGVASLRSGHRRPLGDFGRHAQLRPDPIPRRAPRVDDIDVLLDLITTAEDAYQQLIAEHIDYAERVLAGSQSV